MALYYQTDNVNIEPGDLVIVPYGKDNFEREGIVGQTLIFTFPNMFLFPLDKD
jgi:hypothetical protein